MLYTLYRAISGACALLLHASRTLVHPHFVGMESDDFNKNVWGLNGGIQLSVKVSAIYPESVKICLSVNFVNFYCLLVKVENLKSLLGLPKIRRKTSKKNQ